LDKNNIFGNIKLFNVFGKLLFSAKLNETGTSTIDLGSLSLVDGMYIIAIENCNNKIIEIKRVLVAQN
jgi:hypothetical protein